VKSASNTPMTQLPETPPNDVTGGLDWARDDHAVSVVDTRGREVLRHTVEHTAAGLTELIDVLAGVGCREVAIERPDGPVVEALLAAEMTVVVISPNQVKNLRGRYGSAGNKDDRFDAFVLADTLRTDRARLRALVPDTTPTVALRRACRARRDLIAHRIGAANQLRAHLRAAFPGAVGLFADIDSPISLTFLTRFTIQNQADWLSPTRLGKWLSSVGYSGKVDHAVLHARLAAARRGLTGAGAEAQRRPHPRPRLAHHHLALLARQSRLRPPQTRCPPTPPATPNTSGLTQGFSWPITIRIAVNPTSDVSRL
jgi:Transposase